MAGAVLCAACQPTGSANLPLIDVRSLGPAMTDGSRPASVRAELVTLRVEELEAALASRRPFRLRLLGRTLNLIPAPSQRKGGAWRGHVQEGRTTTGHAVAFADRGSVNLTISAGNRGFEIASRGDGSIIARELAIDVLPDESEPEIEPPEPTTGNPATENRRIEVLLLYDPEIRDRLGNEPQGISRFVRARQAKLDDVYLNGRNRLNSDVVITAYGTYRGRQSFKIKTQSGYLQSWLTATGIRDRVRADLVALVVDRIDGSCGIAPVLGSRSTTDLECEYKWTVAHEIGHNLGARHHRSADQTSASRCNYGLRVPGVARTLMAYECPRGRACPRQPFFSDVRLTVGTTTMGRQCGTSQGAQNVMTVNRNIPRAADYR